MIEISVEEFEASVREKKLSPNLRTAGDIFIPYYEIYDDTYSQERKELFISLGKKLLEDIPSGIFLRTSLAHYFYMSEVPVDELRERIKSKSEELSRQYPRQNLWRHNGIGLTPEKSTTHNRITAIWKELAESKWMVDNGLAYVQNAEKIKKQIIEPKFFTEYVQPVPGEYRLDEFVIMGNELHRDGKCFYQFPTDIAEIARLDDKLFVILTVPNPGLDVDVTGLNLWCLDTNGKLLWKAPDLNEIKKRSGSPLNSYCYSDLRIFDGNDPKVICYVDERKYSTIFASNGCSVLITDKEREAVESMTHEQRIAAWGKRISMRMSASFLASLRIKEISPKAWNPFVPETKHPASFHRK